MSLRAIVGATVIDGNGGAPVDDAVVLVDGDRIRSVTQAASTTLPRHADVTEATGKFVIPGLMDANVHLYAGITPDLLLEYEGRYDEAIAEAAQVALRAGVTTVFETWGPLEALTSVRDRINRGEIAGSRTFVAGNIIGLGGPMSDDFYPQRDVLGPETTDRINKYWEQGVGADLLWMTAEDVRRRVREYIERSGVDFIKYAGSGHGRSRRFISFSEAAQHAIVEEAHRAGLTVQGHTTTLESLRIEIEAGADLLQHADSTGKMPIPQELLETIVDRALPVAALVCTEKHLTWVNENSSDLLRIYAETKDTNDRMFIAAGARLLLTTDGFAWGPRLCNHPLLVHLLKGVADDPIQLGDSHFLWLEAVVERGMAPMEALLSATRYVAEAYHVADEVGTLEAGKRADLVILDADPLADVQNYRRIAQVMKDGKFVDLEALPARRVLTVDGGASAT